MLYEYKVRDWGPIVVVIPGVWGMFYAFIADYFPPDGGDTPLTRHRKAGMEGYASESSHRFYTRFADDGFRGLENVQPLE